MRWVALFKVSDGKVLRKIKDVDGGGMFQKSDIRDGKQGGLIYSDRKRGGLNNGSLHKE